MTSSARNTVNFCQSKARHCSEQLSLKVLLRILQDCGVLLHIYISHTEYHTEWAVCVL